MKRVNRNAEAGSVLLTALIFMAAMGLVMGGLAQLASVNFGNTSGTRDQREVVFTADAALKAAINTYDATDACPTAADLPQVNEITDVQVACVDLLPSGSSGGSGSNQPPLAIIALPDPGESGVNIESIGETYVKGGISSKTTINVDNPSTLRVDTGRTRALTGCGPGTGTIIASDLVCNSAIGPDDVLDTSDVPESEYRPAVTLVPDAVDVPTCPATGPVTMLPGTYTDLTDLNALFSGPCANRTFWFQPAPGGGVGVYYFDFLDSNAAWNLVHSNTKIVGGTLPTIAAAATAGYDGTAATVGLLPVGKRCDQAADGVQFIFGGTSRLNVQDGSIDVCAQHSTTDQEIAVYGLTDSYPSNISAVNRTPSPLAASTPAGDFTNKDNALTVNGTLATATVAASAVTNEITLNGFDVSTIPAGSVINRVRVRVTHNERRTDNPTGNLNALKLSGTLSGTGADLPVVLTTLDTGSLHTDETVSTSAFPTVASLAGLNFKYEADKTGGPAPAFAVGLDGITVEIRFTPPGFRQHSGCLDVTPYSYTSASTCALIKTRGTASNVSLQGTVYAPRAALDIELTNFAQQVFGRGVIVRSLWAKLPGSSMCEFPTCSPFTLPDAVSVPGPSTLVFEVTVYGNKRLRALVEFPLIGDPVVRSWSTLNEV